MQGFGSPIQFVDKYFPFKPQHSALLSLEHILSFLPQVHSPQ